jgi:hypothetical protein
MSETCRKCAKGKGKQALRSAKRATGTLQTTVTTVGDGAKTARLSRAYIDGLIRDAREALRATDELLARAREAVR